MLLCQTTTKWEAPKNRNVFPNVFGREKPAKLEQSWPLVETRRARSLPLSSTPGHSMAWGLHHCLFSGYTQHRSGLPPGSAQGSPLEGLKGPYAVPGIEAWSTACRQVPYPLDCLLDPCCPPQRPVVTFHPSVPLCLAFPFPKDTCHWVLDPP